MFFIFYDSNLNSGTSGGGGGVIVGGSGGVVETDVELTIKQI